MKIIDDSFAHGCWTLWIRIVQKVDEFTILSEREWEVARNNDAEDSFLEAIPTHNFVTTSIVLTHEIINHTHTVAERRPIIV